ncbi:DUF6221 family protein [Streptomyces sp. SID8352]|uniref:DUF6221 family protein n=1 Tax=Streptomyces sp. SID8352 TaxID=2690338 RepID=UPI00136E4A31|nr:DUF6221 family protein [Streptomyces sp. SID8352]MYU22931.1 hypothetical protein [Streptomyces sp. SID8352]
MDELVVWLRAQLDEDERTAQGAAWADDATAWHTKPSPYDTRGAGQRWYVEDALDDGVVTNVDPQASDAEGVARHIARHDPARVLREIDAKRRLVALHEPGETEYVDGDVCMACDVRGGEPFYPCKTLCLLALPYADRPGYQEAWRP